MIVVFFPGFDRLIPRFDIFIPGFDRLIPASIPVTGTFPPTIQMHISKKMCIVLYFEIILFHFIWNKYFSIKKDTSQFWEQIFSKKYSWHQSKAVLVLF